MDRFQLGDLRRLLAAQGAEASAGPCVTLTQPTHGVGRDGEQDQIRFRNLLNQAEAALADGWMRAPEARDYVAPLREVLGDNDFWRHRGQGLAVFLNSDSCERYRVPVSLPEAVSVDDHFHLRALLPMIGASDRFFVLALSQRDVKFFEASRDSIEEVEVAGLPDDMVEALHFDSVDRGAQVHSGMHGSVGKQAAVFHGQGGKADTHKTDLRQFFKQVDSALAPVLRGQTAPLLLAGVDYEFPLFREVSHYAHLADVELSGNCDHLTPHEIHSRAWPLVEPLTMTQQASAASKYQHARNTVRSLNDAAEIVLAARQGRIESLFVAKDLNLWGTVSEADSQVELHDQRLPGDIDLVEDAAMQTVLHRGNVYAVAADKVPDPSGCAANLRF